MLNMDHDDLHDEATRHINSALSTIVLLSHESAFTHVSPAIIEHALFSVTETLTKLDQLFCSVLEDENSAERKP